jgi:hypothetical protein
MSKSVVRPIRLLDFRESFDLLEDGRFALAVDPQLQLYGDALLLARDLAVSLPWHPACR